MSDIPTSGVIESRADFDDSDEGQYEYWCEEIRASGAARKNWHKQASRIVRRYLDERDGQSQSSVQTQQRLNLFNSNIVTMMSMLYGNLPKVDVSRRFADPNDDVSRVAAEMIERLLNNDIEENGEDYNSVLRATLEDRLLSGLGVARVRYEVETRVTQVEVADDNGVILQAEEEEIVFEDAPIDYVHWQDVLWGWARTWKDVNWLGYRSWMNKDEVTARFGAEIAKNLQYKRQTVNEEENSNDAETHSVWQKAEIWEVWDKVKRKVYWLSVGYEKILDSKDDPLQLSNFYPSPPFFIANPTTSLYQPTPDFHLARDLYNEIDILQTRINIITQAVQVVGVYDSEAGDSIGRMLNEGTDNVLIPVKSWGIFSEKGGIQGAVQWMPLADIVNALDKLRELRDETIQLLYQVTGMADIMRGTSSGQYEAVGQSELKAKFGSVRVQALQDSFAKFASDLLQIKAEIISRHFTPQNIALRSNIEKSFDVAIVPEALELIKDPALARLRVMIRPESVAMVDYAQLKQERTEYINSLAIFLQSSAPLFEQDPNMKPFLFQLLQWGLAGFKGSSEIEGVIDRAVETAQKQAQNQTQQPDPEQIKMEMSMQLEQAKSQTELAKISAKAEADLRIREMDMMADIETARAQHQAKLAEIEADMMASIAETQSKMEADLMVEQAKAQANIMQTTAAAQSEVQKDAATTAMEMEKERVKTTLKINEIAATNQAKINEIKSKPRGESDGE